MLRICVVGAYGLVGSNICNILEQDKNNLVIKLKCDEIPEGFEQPDCTIFVAGYGQPQKFSDAKIKTIEINTSLLIKHLNLLRPGGKFLYVSSSEVYSGAPSPHTEDMIGTTTPQHPRACYIEGKRCGEAICMAYKEQGYDVKIARLALAYGPGTKKGDTRVLNQFIEQALTTGEIKMKDEGSAIRTYGYVESIANTLLDILFEGKDVVYNVGGQNKVTVLQLAKDIAYQVSKLEGKTINVILGDKSLEGSPDSVELSLTKVFNEFPKTFMWSWEEGLRKTIEYQKQLYGIK